MRDNPNFTFSIHAPIYRARASDVTDALILDVAHFAGPDIAIYTGDADLSAKLAATINSTIEAHAADLAQRTTMPAAAE